MKPDPKVIEVMYRKYTDKSGEVLAVFPYEVHHPSSSTVTCYAHIGQHGNADMQHVLSKTRPATRAEYRDLHRELQSIYERSHSKSDPVFSLRIIQRRNFNRLAAAIKEARL